MRRLVVALLVLAGSAVPAARQEIPLEYRVKAVYLFNFVRFIEWPPAEPSRPITICIARPNPFGTVLADTIRGEMVNGRPLAMRVVDSPEDDCAVLFVPSAVADTTFLRATQNAPVLTVGESPDFIRQGGIVNFVREGTNVRFVIDEAAARRAGLRISSRLLRLARMPNRS